jgi:hypothetical protein
MNFKKTALILTAVFLACSALLIQVMPAYAADSAEAQADSSATATVTVNATGDDPTVTVTVSATASATATAGESVSPPALPPSPPRPPVPPPPPPPPPPQDCCRRCDPCCPCYPNCGWPCECRWSVCVRPAIVVVAQPQPQPQRQIDPPPVVNAFSASPSFIEPGQSATLTWTVSDVLERNVNVTISPGVGSVPASGSYTVTPGSTTTYTLTATNEDGTVTASTTVTVVAPAATLSTGSGPETGAAGTGSESTGTTFTLSFGDGFSPRLLYVLLAVLMAAATIAVLVIVTRKPALALAAEGAGTRVGHLSCVATTRTGSDSAHTKAVASCAGPRLVTPDGKQVPLPANAGILGRKDFRPLLTPDEAALVSREHLYINREGGNYYIEDKGSTNGTRLNGTDISGKGRQLLKDGDEIRLANVLTLIFRA